MTYFKITYLPLGFSLFAGSEPSAFSVIQFLCSYYELDSDSLLSDFWVLLHDFPLDCSASFADFLVECSSVDFED